MTAPRTLELCGSLSINPARLIKAAHILVKGLSQEGAGGDGAVRAVRLFILSKVFKIQRS